MFGCGIDVILICLLSFSDIAIYSEHQLLSPAIISSKLTTIVFCLVQEMAEAVTKDFGRIDIFVHSLANGPEVTKPLLETSRRGYLATISASSYSFVSLLRHFLPIMNPVLASTCRYEGGMSSAKAALESDTKVLAFELHLLATKHQSGHVGSDLVADTTLCDGGSQLPAIYGNGRRGNSSNQRARA
ncbi:hypothetical protein ZIOFF_028146 [Zingiber officinale]|uniref:Uncharacterized protein n=1 Tax=Zingiber officinale TaxID=94328 RepID=A0A8J5GKW6_ZINOF|nr:hypothetical protein ZIOFF_028146 [Zingiber officinale]